MRLNSKGQVTIPAALRRKHGLREGDEVQVVEDGGKLRIVRPEEEMTPGARLVARMRGRGSITMTTGEIMALTRGE